MVEYTGEVTEAQWAKIEPLLPTPPRSPNGGHKRIPERPPTSLCAVPTG